MNEKPYIEYKGKKYEFEANFSLKKQFDKDNKEMAMKIVKKGDIKNKQKDIAELEKFVKENPNITIDDLSKDSEMLDKLEKLYDLTNDFNNSEFYEKYCFEMLENKYNINKETFEDMLNCFADDYGIEYVYVLLQKVCEKVFTQQVGEKNKKPLPDWMQN